MFARRWAGGLFFRACSPFGAVVTSPVITRCTCGYQGTRAFHRAHLDALDRKRASISRMQNVGEVLELLDRARTMVSNCLLQDLKRRRDERVAA